MTAGLPETTALPPGAAHSGAADSGAEGARLSCAWVFAYGSLLWNPGFTFRERQRAIVRGYHRSLCIFSHVHRGTAEVPGLVLGLDRGGSCVGAAYRVDERQWPETLSYLRAREQVTPIYKEASLSIRTEDGRNVSAIAYVADRAHHQYAGRLAYEDLERLVRQGAGVSGRNVDYVLNTHEHLVQMGIRDPSLAYLAARLK